MPIYIQGVEQSSGAPTDADYLVGTTQGGLSAEIVAGAAPAGELGGTWAAPTVDATHSGSAHHAVYAHPNHSGEVTSVGDGAQTVAATHSGSAHHVVESGDSGTHTHSIYILHSLATALNDVLMASGAGVFVKQTLAQLKTALAIAADIATHAAISAASTHGSIGHAAAHGPAQHTEGTAWRQTYLNASGDETEIVLGASGTVLTSGGAAAAPSYAAAAAARIPVWVQPHYVSGTGATLATNNDNYGVVTFGDNAAIQRAYFVIPIPVGFTTIQKAVLVCWASNTANLVYNIYTTFGAAGEAITANSDSIGDTTQAMTASQIRAIDISAALTAIAAGDYVGFQFVRLGDNAADTIASLYVAGLLLEYS